MVAKKEEIRGVRMKKKFNERLEIRYFKTERGTINYMGTFDFSYNYEIENWYYPRDSVKNFIFHDRLILIAYVKGSSSVKFLFKSEITGNGYEMFLQDAFSLTMEGKNLLSLSGKFCFIKRGNNFGVYLLED